MILLSLDSSHRDESNDSKIIQIGVIFVEIEIFAKIIAIFAKISGQIGSGQLSDLTRIFGLGWVGSGHWSQVKIQSSRRSIVKYNYYVSFVTLKKCDICRSKLNFTGL